MEGSPNWSAVHGLEGDCATRGRRWASLREQAGVVRAQKVQTQKRRAQGRLSSIFHILVWVVALHPSRSHPPGRL